MIAHVAAFRAEGGAWRLLTHSTGLVPESPFTSKETSFRRPDRKPEPASSCGTGTESTTQSIGCLPRSPPAFSVSRISARMACNARRFARIGALGSA